MEQIIKKRIKELEKKETQLKEVLTTIETLEIYFEIVKKISSIQDTLIELYKISIEYYKEENNERRR